MYKFAKGLGGGDLGVSKNIETQLGWLRFGEGGGGSARAYNSKSINDDDMEFGWVVENC